MLLTDIPASLPVKSLFCLLEQVLTCMWTLEESGQKQAEGSREAFQRRFHPNWILKDDYELFKERVG